MIDFHVEIISECKKSGSEVPTLRHLLQWYRNNINEILLTLYLRGKLIVDQLQRGVDSLSFALIYGMEQVKLLRKSRTLRFNKSFIGVC